MAEVKVNHFFFYHYYSPLVRRKVVTQQMTSGNNCANEYCVTHSHGLRVCDMTSFNQSLGTEMQQLLRNYHIDNHSNEREQ